MVFGIGPKKLHLVVHPNGDAFTASRGEQLLAVLKQRKLPVSYSCEDGRCGLCRYELVQGEVIESARPPWGFPGLSSVWKLACQSILVDNCVVRLVDPDNAIVHLPRKRMKGMVVAKRQLAERIMAIRVQVPTAFTFTPGQFAQLQFRKDLARTFSMANGCNNGELEFHVQKHQYGQASSFVWEELGIKDEVRIDGPLGVSYLRTADAHPILCVASESGLAPMLAVLRGMRLARMTNPVHIYIGFLRIEGVYGTDEVTRAVDGLESVRSVNWVAYSAPADSPAVRAQTLTAAIEEDFSQLSDFRAYVYGSPHAVEGVVRVIRKLGLPDERLHADPFTPTGV